MISIERIENILREFQVKAFGKVLLTGALALGGLTAMNIDTPKAHADGASEFCRYICGPSETLNGFTPITRYRVQLRPKYDCKNHK